VHSARVIPKVALVGSDRPIVSDCAERPVQASADLASHRLQRLGMAGLGAMLRHSAHHSPSMSRSPRHISVLSA
jgi:hypothetical protein